MLSSFIFFFAYLLFTGTSIYCLLNMFALNTTFKILFNTLGFIICNAATLILLGLDFLGIVYIIVYAGAILVLFLSVLMLVDLRSEDTSEIVIAGVRDQKYFKAQAILKLSLLVLYLCSSMYIYKQFLVYAASNEIFLSGSRVTVWSSVFHSRNLIY
jgi:NADH:ubiquinone oxidoreductase subunit 6 (subunit J)